MVFSGAHYDDDKNYLCSLYYRQEITCAIISRWRCHNQIKIIKLPDYLDRKNMLIPKNLSGADRPAVKNKTKIKIDGRRKAY